MTKRVLMTDLIGAKPPGAATAPQDGATAGGPSADRDEPRLIKVKTDRLLPNPHNPRDEIGDVDDLRSIAEVQQQSLLVITKAAYLGLYPDELEACRGIDYIVANGNRRHHAAVKYGRAELMCIADDSVASSRARLMRAAYDENVARRDFDPIEEAKAVAGIVSEYPTAKAAAAAQGWSETLISHRKNLLRLHPDLQAMVRSKARGGEGISVRVARDLGSVKGIEDMSAAEQLALLDAIVTQAQEQKAAAKAARLAAKDTTRAAAPVAVTAAPAPAAAVGADEAAGPVGPAGVREFSAENSVAPAVGRPEPDVPASPAAPAPVVPEAEPPAAAGIRPPAPEPAGQFSAENSAGHTPAVPDQRHEAAQSSPAAADPGSGSGKERTAAVPNWHDLDAFADAICRILSKEEAVQLFQAVADRLRDAEEVPAP